MGLYIKRFCGWPYILRTFQRIKKKTFRNKLATKHTLFHYKKIPIPQNYIINCEQQITRRMSDILINMDL